MNREQAKRILDAYLSTCRKIDADGIYPDLESEKARDALREMILDAMTERTCHIEWRDDSYDTDLGYERDGAYFCTSCRADLPYPLQECWDDYQAGNYEKLFNYCPKCGCKVVSK